MDWTHIYILPTEHTLPLTSELLNQSWYWTFVGGSGITSMERTTPLMTKDFLPSSEREASSCIKPTGPPSGSYDIINSFTKKTVLNTSATPKHLTAPWSDLEKAYDTTWQYGIMENLHVNGLHGHLLLFIKICLTFGHFHIRIKTTYSNRHSQELWVIYKMNQLPTDGFDNNLCYIYSAI